MLDKTEKDSNAAMGCAILLGCCLICLLMGGLIGVLIGQGLVCK